MTSAEVGVSNPHFAVPEDVRTVDPEVERRMQQVLDEERERWRAAGDDGAECVDVLRDFLVGGKRIRPALCLWGYAGAGGRHDDETRAAAVVDAAVALELLHAFALVHDDVMDGSTSRRGGPSVHVGFGREHRDRDWAGDADRYGTAMAVLVGDIAFALAGRLAARFPPAAQEVWGDLIRDLTVGQYLDVTGAARGSRDERYATRVARLKSGAYTIERPLQLGATFAAPPEGSNGSNGSNGIDGTGPGAVARAYSAYGRPLGEAFQLRDDLLGVYGDPEVTGKPAGEDLRDGKPTLLLAYASSRCTGADAVTLSRVGATDLTPAEVDALRDLLVRCGARRHVERRIATLVESATGALGDARVAPEVAVRLRMVAADIAWREV